MSLCDESVFSYHQEVQGTHVTRIIYDQEEWLVIFLMRIQNSQNFFKTGLAISHCLQCNYCLVIFFLPQVEYQLIEQLVNYSKVKVSFGRVEFGGLRSRKSDQHLLDVVRRDRISWDILPTCIVSIGLGSGSSFKQDSFVGSVTGL